MWISQRHFSASVYFFHFLQKDMNHPYVMVSSGILRQQRYIFVTAQLLLNTLSCHHKEIRPIFFMLVDQPNKQTIQGSPF